MGEKRPLSAPTQDRVLWVLGHQELWDDRDQLREAMIAAKMLSPNLSNWRFVLDCLVERCQKIKKTANLCRREPLKPRSNLVLTVENFDELMNTREIKDAVGQMKHPVKAMDDDGYTYYDYAIYKRRKHNRPVLQVIEAINIYLAGGDIPFMMDGHRKQIGGRFN